ncbi:PEP-CTERM sorting domain-containing protein [Pontiella agarivorans]|uniref:PEP-CTERM sorting domain-containing protein n=1 Tax=Pontiella agarivorans TaxID=3038953 RepID=A0ABU5N0P0_9BACT|nr:PEP-CTERM sorting domain-containing protein [Pontiella agarivorans]MDZ8120014.1 PEP-CTERM sorting domain-containing protein [Pontiella agarivorans]
MKYTKELVTAVVFAVATSALADPLSFTEDFDTAGLDNFTLVDRTAAGSNAGKSSLVAGVTGQAGHVGNGVTYGDNSQAGAWLQANGIAVDANSDFTLSYSFKFEQEGTFDDAILAFGNLDAGNYYTSYTTEGAGGSLLYIAKNGKREGNSANASADFGTTFADDTWHSATYSWVAATETLTATVGSASYSVVLDGSTAYNVSLKDYTDGIQFGFGTHNDRASFDDIQLTGTAIPEPATLGLIGAFGGAIIFVRRRLII